jgi:hypothetical protein
MDKDIVSRYLSDPESIENALARLEKDCLALDFKVLYNNFENNLGIETGEGFPITAVHLGGLVCRARLNDDDFMKATSISQIGAKSSNICQGRANPNNIAVFYGTNNKKTATMEILQAETPGHHIVTIGCWKSENGLRVANLIDGSDPDFKDLSFAHSFPKEYLKGWPELQRKSALLLIDFFREKFKKSPAPGLYNITNVIAAICYSLQGVDGIGYAAISDKFGGFNVAISDPSLLKCVEVERWFINKINNDEFEYMLMEKGRISNDGSISWLSDK